MTEVSFSANCQTAEDFARRFRVMAAVGDQVTFTMSADALRAWAKVMDRTAHKPDLWIVTHELEVPSASMIWVLAVAAWIHLIHFVEALVGVGP